MAVMKLSQKDIRKNNEDKIKLDRSQISYDSAYVSDLEKRHKESVSAMESYRSRISSGGFLSSDDLAAYRKAMDSYIDTSESLNGLSRVFGSGSVDDNQWHNTVASMEKDYKGISDYYSKWKTEADFKVAMEQAKANEQRMAEITSGYDPVKNQQEAQTGWGDYLQTQERIAQSKAQAEEDKSWFEKLAGYLGDIGQDTSLPVHTTQQVSQGYREQETAMKKPDDRWTEEQQQTFGYLWNQDRRKAAEYAQTINNMLNTQQEQEQLRKIQGWATDSFGAGAAHTAGALLTAPLGMADYMGDLIAQGTLGYIPESDGQISPFEYSQMVTGSISQHLNEYGTLNENIPVIGGKGLGDVYGLGTSIAQSALAAYSGGSGQALVQFFGSAAASGVDDALKRGANGDQAIAYGTMSGLAEALAEKLGVDNLLKIGASNTMRQLVMNIVKQGAAEGLEEGATTLMNNFADQLVLQDKSNFYGLVEQYMSQGLAEGDAKTQAWLDMANDLAFDMVAGFASGAIHAGPQTAYNTFMQNDYAKNTYGGFQQELVGEALEIDPDNAYAQKMQGRLDKGKDLSGGQLNEIIRQNTAAITAQDMQSIQTAAETRLTELGETGDVATVAAALTKQAAGEKLSQAEQQAISNSKYGQRVANELNPENIRSGGYASAWAEQIDTNRINAQEYSRLVEDAQLPQETAETTGVQVVPKSENVAQGQQAESMVAPETPATTVRENRTVAENETVPANDQQMTGKLTGKESLQVVEESSEAEETVEEPVTLENASQKYGAQAKAMIHTYQAGQDVAKYDKAYQAAYDMGKSGVALSYALNSEATSYLTEAQKGLAYEAGEAASNTAAHALDAKNKAAANGKTGRKKGVVRGEGVTIADLKQTFNDTQGKAYKYLSTVAEVTGIDIVLYRSEAGPDGKFQGAQGRYRRSEPGTIYIDLNAGLSDIKNADDLAKYAMLRTFAHEFTHFIENWNPIQYNELRKVVFDTLTQRGENVQDLIEDKQARNPGMDYDKASREVVAEAMTDILPDVNFVQELAQKHKNIFTKLLEKLKEFVDNLCDYYNSIGHNRSREANAIKEQVGETVKYLDSIVQLFDNVAVQAVENYQQTVATEEVAVSEMETTTTVSETESVAAAEEETPAAVAKSAAAEEEKAIPPKAETEEAKQELRKAVRMPIQGTNAEALLAGIQSKELSMDTVTLSGTVEGFNAEQREHLVRELLDGVYTERDTIQINVPYDGKFEISNTPGNIAKVLENLKVKVKQEVLFDKKTFSLLTSNGDMRIVKMNGASFLTNSYVMLPAEDAAVAYVKKEHKAKEQALHVEVEKAIQKATNPLTDAPTEAKLGKTPVLMFEADGKTLYFDKRFFAPLDGGKLYYAEVGGAGILKSVDESGNVLGYLMGIKPGDASKITDRKPSKLESFRKKATPDRAIDKPKTESQKKPADKEKTVKTVKPETVESSVKLEDFGEKIGGARKDQWSKRGLLSDDLTEMNDREREKNVKKDNVWKRPDYRKRIEGGEDRNVLFVRNEIRKALNQTIRYPYQASEERRLQIQKEFVDTVREIQTMAENAVSKEDFTAMGRKWLISNGYIDPSGKGYTDKWRKNPALQGSDYVYTIEHLVRNFDSLSKLADKANFAVDAEKKVPTGFAIHEDERNGTCFIAKGSWVIKHSIPSYEEALELLRNAAATNKKKTRFVPHQLLEVHRKGPDYRGGKDIKGQDYLDVFGFRGGEFGNWMNEKDRRVSMNYGFDALKDLADAMGIADGDISLSGNLSIAFGARGQGLSGAAAHYERERHVINLTKMNGAGSLAHEWFHALDDFIGGYGSNMATDSLRGLPERTKNALRDLLTVMQYRDATQEETDMAATKSYEQAKRSVTYQVNNQFNWVAKVENGTLTDADMRYYSRKPTAADAKRFHELLDNLLETGDAAIIDELSALRKEVNGRVIPKEDRESIGYRLYALKPTATKNVQKMRTRSDFYNNSRRFGELHQKDGDYWDSTVEMAARAFACYVADKTGKHNDYLSAHADSAVTLDMDKNGNLVSVRAYPVGQERKDINASFDRLIDALKKDGFLHERGETVKPDDVQYQNREYLSEDESYDNRGIQTGADRESGVDRPVQGKDWSTANDGRGYREDARRTRKAKAWGDLSAKRRLGIVKTVENHINSSDNYGEIRLALAATIGKPVTEMSLRDKQAAIEMLAQELYESITDLNNSRPLVENRWSLLGNIRPIIEAIYGENVQFQQRTDTLTDREVLALAASQVKTADLTEAEKSALDIFQQRLSKLEALQTERAEQGRLYKEQQFGAKVDRVAAAQTLNRMHTLDSQIQKASADVLSVEEKTVLKRVLQKARTVVEQQERQHGQEILKRWRDRRNNADAIKKYRDRIRGDVDELTNWVLHPDNKNVVKHIPDALKNTVIPFLSSINFMSKRSLGGGNPTIADEAFKEQLGKLEDVMEKTVKVDDMYSNYTDLPPDFMENLHHFVKTTEKITKNSNGDFIINQMTSEELQELSKVVRTLKKYIMQMNRFHVNAMFQHVYEAGENSIDFLGQLKPAEKTGGVSQFLLWQQMRPAYAFERFGDGGMAIYDGLRRGQATLAFNTKKIQAFAEKAYTTAEVKAWENQVKTIRIGPGKTVTMRVSQIMSLYELNKRKQAQGHILGKGIRVATFKNGKQKISDVGQRLTPGELNLILRELTPRQKEVADQLQQFMQKQGGEWGNYVTVARFGEKQFGEENYFPINSDGRHLQVDADEKPGAAALYALLNMGFTKQTQEKAKNRIIVYSIFDVFANHMASMAQYNAFALPVVDALKWFNYQRVAVDEDGSKTILGSVREQMDRAFGVPEENRPGSGRRGYAQSFVINIIKAFNGTAAQGTPYDSGGMKMLHRYNLSQVSYNFRVVVQQPLAITRAALLLDYASIIKGMKLSPAAIRKNIQEMQHYSGIAAWKSLGFYDVNISRGLTSLIKHDDTWIDKVDNVGMWGAEKADTLTWAGIWSAAKEEVIRKQKLTPKSEGFYEAVTKLFEDVIYKTQVVDSVLTKNEFMRDKGFLARSVGSFMSEPTTTASMLLDAYDKVHMDMQRGLSRQQAIKKNGRMIVRTAYVYGIGALVLAAVQAVADAFRDDDDYQEFYEKWLEAFSGNLLDEAVPLNKLPWASQGYELLKELVAIWGGADIYGRLNNVVWVEIADNFIAGSKILADHFYGVDTNYELYGGAYKLLQAVSGMTGLPMASATREIITAWNNIVGAMAPSLKVKIYELSDKSQIKYAYLDGYLSEEEAIEQLIAQGIAKTEQQARKIMKDWN